MKDSKKKKPDEKPDKKPAVSSEEILQILTSPLSEEIFQKNDLLDSRDFDWASKEKEEEEVMKLWLKAKQPSDD